MEEKIETVVEESERKTNFLKVDLIYDAPWLQQSRNLGIEDVFVCKRFNSCYFLRRFRQASFSFVA